MEEAERHARESYHLELSFGQDLAPVAQSLLCLGQVLLRAKRFEEAEAALREGLENT